MSAVSVRAGRCPEWAADMGFGTGCQLDQLEREGACPLLARRRRNRVGRHWWILARGRYGSPGGFGWRGGGAEPHEPLRRRSRESSRQLLCMLFYNAFALLSPLRNLGMAPVPGRIMLPILTYSATNFDLLVLPILTYNATNFDLLMLHRYLTIVAM